MLLQPESSYPMVLSSLSVFFWAGVGSGLFVLAWYKKRKKPSMGGQVDINNNEFEYAED